MLYDPATGKKPGALTQSKPTEAIEKEGWHKERSHIDVKSSTWPRTIPSKGNTSICLVLGHCLYYAGKNNQWSKGNTGILSSVRALSILTLGEKNQWSKGTDFLGVLCTFGVFLSGRMRGRRYWTGLKNENVRVCTQIPYKGSSILPKLQPQWVLFNLAVPP